MSKTTDEKVQDVKTETSQRLDAVKAKFAEARTVLAAARKQRDTAISDADSVYAESYKSRRSQMSSEIEDLEQAYSVLRSEICERWNVDSANLTETHDAAVAAANKDYTETQEASRVVFGEQD